MSATDAPVPPPWFHDGPVPEAERAFYVEEFRGDTIVVALAEPTDEVVAAVARTAEALGSGGAHLVAVAGGGAEALAAGLPSAPQALPGPSGAPDAHWLADLWMAIADGAEVVVAVEPGRELPVAAELAAALRARKLVVTDPDGGWGIPPRSFADLVTHAGAFEAQLAERRGGAVVAAVRTALDGGATNVNLCRPEDLDRELFTFDGAGTLFTSGGYLELGPLRVDDLPAVERLVGQGVEDGVLRPRTRHEVARLAVTGLGARIAGRGHLAGLVSLETEPYRAEQVGEVACLYTVSRFSGAGAGGLLIDGLVERATADGLRAVFAVTVSDAAVAFFERKGFAEVAADRLPAAKWAGYDAERRARARCLWLDVTGPEGAHQQGSLGF
jgi:amino-acid N-acetyltransferase